MSTSSSSELGGCLGGSDIDSGSTTAMAPSERDYPPAPPTGPGGLTMCGVI